MKQKRIMLMITAVFLAAVLMLTGCAGDGISQEDMDKLIAENAELQDKAEEYEQYIEELENLIDESAEVEQIETEPSTVAMGVDCLLGIDEEPGANEISFDGTVSITAKINAVEGKRLDYWVVSGEQIDTNEQSITVETDGNTVIQAVLRDELTVTGINADIQLLAENGNPEGEKMQEYNFEEEGMISIYVSANVPSGKEINYWKIDGYPFYFSREITYFKVFDLDRASTFEPVFKEAPKAVEKVTVSCSNARFSGGGYTNATSGQVAKGTTITVTGINDVGSPQYWKINGSDKWSMGKSFSYTVNYNTTFVYTGVN